MCLTPSQIESLLRVEPASAELVTFRQHARQCPGCRAAVSAAAERVLIDTVGLEGKHPDSALLSQYLDGEPSSQMRLLLDLHLEGCPACRQRLEAMRSARQAAENRPAKEYAYQPVLVTPPSSGFRMILRYAGAMGATALVTALCFGVFLQHPANQIKGHSTQPPLGPRLIASQPSSGAKPIVVKPAALQIASAKDYTALNNEIAGLSTDANTRGPRETESTIVLKSPLKDEAMRETTVKLEWNRFPGASRYVVTVSIEGEDPIVSGRALSQTFLTLRNLHRGQRYNVEIVVRDSADTLLRTQSLQFTILNTAQEQELKSAEQMYAWPDPRLVRLYLKWNLYHDALHALEALSQERSISLQNREKAKRSYEAYRKLLSRQATG
ncbi:MAG TPA: zf-HC2 domain-containing protein [Chthonomonadaceae bacterium]|nr:zf-HC2 domain-containing protein [Chthonomonadaceae bacterium]